MTMIVDPETRIRIPNNWTLRGYQEPAWDAWMGGIKRLLLVWHRRAGKDDFALHATALAMMTRVGNYWHCLPEYAQAKKAIWEAINPHTGMRRIDEAFPKELRKRTDNGTMMIEMCNGSIWKCVGSDDPDTLVGAPPVGLIFSEWALSNPSAWAYLAPILAENGGWAMFITTPRGRNHVTTMVEGLRDNPKWFVEVLTVDDTKAVTLERIEEDRENYITIFGEDTANALIEQEYWCSFEAAILGSYYGKQMVAAEKEGRITTVPVDPEFPVDLAWDIGVDDPNAIWAFQRAGAEIHIVDYVEGTGMAMEYWANWKKERGYTGFDYVPHDAKQRSYTAAMGPGGKAKQRIETMIEVGLKPIVVPVHARIDGINAVRQLLPRCIFDKENCKQGLECMRQYQAEWDDDNKVFKPTPLHNWASHGADAFRTLAMGYKQRPQPEAEDVTKPGLPRPETAAHKNAPVKVLQEMTYDEFIATRKPRREGHIS